MLENSCKIEVDGDLTSYGITLGQGAFIKCEHLHASDYINLNDNSMIKVENNSWFNNCSITGPTAPNSYALLKLYNIQQANWTGNWQSEVTQGYVINNVYCEYKGGGRDATWNFEYCCLNGTAGGNGKKEMVTQLHANPERLLNISPKADAPVKAILREKAIREKNPN